MQYCKPFAAISFFLFIMSMSAAAQLTGVGTVSPQARLDIVATNTGTPDNRDGILIPRVIQFPAVNPGASQNGMLVFLSAAAGNKKPGFYYWDHPAAAWKAVGEGKSWGVLGNDGTDTSMNFIGTTDAVDLVLRARNERAGHIGITNTSWGLSAHPFSGGINNTAIGRRSMYYNSLGDYNTAIGYNAQYFLYDGSNNTSLGVNSMYLSNGSNNTAIGKDVMYFNNTGSSNAVLGMQSLYNNSTGYSNSGVGAYSLFNNRTGRNLTAFGDSSLFSNFGASLNTAAGSKSLYSTTSGAGNSGFGARSMYNNTTGANNTGLGANSDVISNNLSNATALGNNAKVGCSNCLVLGDSTNVKVGIGTGFPATARLVINAGAGNNGIDLSSSDSYAEMRQIRNTLGADKDLYFNFNNPAGSAIHFYSEGLTETMKVSGQKVSIGTSSPALSAVLDVSSTNKGFLPPRMNKGQRNGIGSPVAGLMVFCTDCGEGQAQIYNGSKWTDLTGGIPQGVVPGEDYAGGTVIFVYQPGSDNYKPNEVHGFIAAKVDQTTTNWGCSGTSVGASSFALGAGKTNTDLILTNCNVGGTAARMCADLVLNGYADWFLPSLNEIIEMYFNGAAVGGGLSGAYWTSSESGTTTAYSFNFSTGSGNPSPAKTSNLKVRAIRSF